MIELDVRRLDLPANLEQQYTASIDAAIVEMTAVERGDHVNRDEDRAVGHYWLRRPEIAPPAQASAIRDAVAAIERFVAGPASRFKKVLLIGIGGSALGPQFLVHARRRPGVSMPIFFFDNTDPEGFARTFQEIEAQGGLGDTLTIVISKGGTTPETRNGMLVAQRAYADAGLNFADHAVAVTQPGSKLEELAAAWLLRLPIWEWVGGRTSLFAAVGLLPAALLGLDWRALLAGAAEMDRRTGPGDRNPHSNPALMLALAWLHLGTRRGLHHMVMLPYSDRLSLFAAYLQQLIMESLGKNGLGLTVFGNKGSTDQHSYVQQLRDGRADFFAGFIRVLCPRGDSAADMEVAPGGVTSADYLAAFEEGTAQALHDAGRPSFRVTIDRVDEPTIGGLVALFERAVGYYAPMVGINAYHQPGVQAGKKAADEYLALQLKLIEHLRASATGLDVVELTALSGGKPELVEDILHRLCANSRFRIVSPGPRRFRILPGT